MPTDKERLDFLEWQARDWEAYFRRISNTPEQIQRRKWAQPQTGILLITESIDPAFRFETVRDAIDAAIEEENQNSRNPMVFSDTIASDAVTDLKWAQPMDTEPDEPDEPIVQEVER